MNLHGHPILRGKVVPRSSGNYGGFWVGGNSIPYLIIIILITIIIITTTIIIIITYSNNNFNGKYWAILLSQNFPDYPGNWFTDGALYIVEVVNKFYGSYFIFDSNEVN
jgi:hypothetical protein